MKKSKVFLTMLASVSIIGIFTACSSDMSSEFDATTEIHVASREDGSGTRGAFIELFGIEQKNESGEKVDLTTEEANITNSTSVMMTTIANDQYAIGYISLGSLNDSVKALNVEGVSASQENIINNEYKIARPFNIVTKDHTSPVTEDFISYILSADGQKIIEDNGYISAASGQSFSGTNVAGKIVIAGSSSVSPVMEKLKEAYMQINQNAEIEIQQSDSTTGINSLKEGICDIGMASREIKDSERESGMAETTIAMDGIAVIVNNDNPLANITCEQVMSIYIADTLYWDELIAE